MPQERLVVLLDHYQRRSAESLLLSRTAHDVAFSTTATLDQHIEAHTNAGAALLAAHQALAAIRDHLAFDPELPSGRELAAPIVNLQ